MRTTQLADMQRRLADSGQPPLGCIVIYSLGEAPIGAGVGTQVLRRWLAQLGIGTTPKEVASADAFARAASDCERKRMTTTATGVFANILVRALPSDSRRIYRQVVVETVDGENRRLSYEPALLLSLPRKYVSEPFVDRLLSNQLAEDAVRDLAVIYNHHLCHYPAQTLRAVVRNILDGMDSVAIKNAVYFVPYARVERLDRLQDLFSLMQSVGVPCRMNIIAIPDAVDERAMVQEALDTRSIAGLDKLTNDLNTALNSGTVTVSDCQVFLGRLSAATSTAAKYEENLSMAASGLKDKVAYVQAQISVLLDKASD